MANRRLLANSKNVTIITAAFVVAAVSVCFPCPRSSAAWASARWGNIQYIGPDTISDIAAEASPAVVNITASSSLSRDQLARLRQSGRSQSDPGHRLRRYYGIDANPPTDGDSIKVSGSGIIVRPDGYILTSLHVVENASSIAVSLSDGRTFDATLAAKDRYSDLAVLRISAQDLPVVKFGDPNALRVGDWVIAIGNQFGLGGTVTHGLVSGLGREAKGFEKSFGARTGAVKFIQTDAPINPGSSGGPLLNLKGEVVGINTFIRDDAQNIGFAIPSNVVKEVADKLANAGQIAHPYIGITMRDTDVKPGASPPVGVEVADVKFRSPAATAGLRPGDVIMSIDQSAVRTSDDVSHAVAIHKIGENMKLKIVREGGDKELTVRVDSLPDDSD